MGTEKVDADAIALGISLKCTLGEGREIVFQTHVPRDTVVEQIDVLVDRIHSVAQRQLAIAEIELMGRENVMCEREYQRIEADQSELLAREEASWNLSETRRGPWDVGKLPAQAKQAITNQSQSMLKYKERRDANKARIAELNEWLTTHRKS